MNDEFSDEMEKRRAIFSYITVEDDFRLKKIVKEMSPQEARKITQEGSDLSMLHWAALKGALEIQNWLIDKMEFPPDLDNNESIWSPAHMAVIGGKDHCLEALLTRKPEVINRPDKRGCTPAHLAAAHGRFHCLKYILKSTRVPPNINMQCTPNKWTPLMYATWHGRISCVEILIRHGAATDMTDSEGRTTLHLAALEGHLPLVKYFLENGCHDLNKCMTAVDNNGFTALKLAENNKKDEIVKYLIEKLKDPKTWENDDDIRFPGHIAATNGDLLNIKTLIEQGNISLNDTDPRGYTMLHKACIGNHLSVVKWLVSKGASIWTKTLGQEMPSDIARRRGHLKIVEFLGEEEKRFEPFLNGEKGQPLFIPLLSSIDSDSLSSMTDKRLHELIQEKKFDIVSLEERIMKIDKELRDSESRSILTSSITTDQSEENRRKMRFLYLESLKLNYQLNVAKFNLYQLTKEPTAKELEIGHALADCEHEFVEISDQLVYEREQREQIEAELSRVRHQLLKLRDYILKNDASNELVSMVVSFDRFLSGNDPQNMVLEPPVFNPNKRYSIQFEVDPVERINITKMTYFVDSKLVVDSDIKNLSKKQFLEHVKSMIPKSEENSKCSKRKKSKAKKSKILSPKGGVFVTNK